MVNGENAEECLRQEVHLTGKCFMQIKTFQFEEVEIKRSHFFIPFKIHHLMAFGAFIIHD